MSYDRDSLILGHLDLAKNIATREWRTATHALKHDDMISLANLGLVDAADRWEAYCDKNGYDPAAVQFFKVFASLRIRGTIRDHIRSADWATRTLRSKSKRLKEAGQDEGIPVEELAEKTGMSVSDINKVNARLAARPISLDAHLSTTYGDSDAVPKELRDSMDTEASAFSRDILSTFVKTVKHQPYEIQVVLVLHYYSKLDLRRISEALQLSEVKVSQLHMDGVLAVKQALTDAATERG
jgi:RNA polymerase sigma factor for flagellar operon FliA